MPRPPAPLASPDEIEQEFYEALQNADIERLMAVWSDDDDIVCVHPGGPRVVGTAAIRAAFDSIFSNGAIDARPEKVRRLHTHASAVHSVLEQVRVMTDEGPRQGWVIATNVYVKTAFGWRMVAHHASPGTPGELQEMVEAGSTIH
jgi:ketosteroid isomerase-like protein